MGWSARREACEEFDRWAAACVAQTGSSNVYAAGGDQYFFERGREQADGSITGTVFRFVSRYDGGEASAVRAGSFKIGPEGDVIRWPKGLRVVVENTAERKAARAAMARD